MVHVEIIYIFNKTLQIIKFPFYFLIADETIYLFNCIRKHLLKKKMIIIKRWL